MSDTNKQQVFAVADARTFEGDPYEVAERAVKQVHGVLAIARTTLDGARVMVRNAELERQLALDGSCDAGAFEDGPHAKILDKIASDLHEAQRKLAMLSKAAAFNPKAKIGRP